MNMASGSLWVGLVVFLVGVMVAETSAHDLTVSIVNITFVNELDAPLKVTLPAAPLGTNTTTTIAARRNGMLQQQVQGPLLRKVIYFEVRGCVYLTAGSPQGRVTGETGTVKFYVTGHCGTGVPGLQFVSTVEGVACTKLGCAAPVDPKCTCPIS